MASIGSTAPDPYLARLEGCFASIKTIRDLPDTDREGIAKTMAIDPILRELERMELNKPAEKIRLYTTPHWVKRIKNAEMPYVIFRCVSILLGNNSQKPTEFPEDPVGLVQHLYSGMSCRLVRSCTSGFFESLVTINRFEGSVITLNAFQNGRTIWLENNSKYVLQNAVADPLSEIPEPSRLNEQCREFVQHVQKSDSDYKSCVDAIRHISPSIPPLNELIIHYIFGAGHAQHPLCSLGSLEIRLAPTVSMQSLSALPLYGPPRAV